MHPLFPGADERVAENRLCFTFFAILTTLGQKALSGATTTSTTTATTTTTF